MATYASNGGNCNSQFTANVPRNLAVKKIVNQSRFERIMAMILWPHFVWPTPYTRRIGRLYIDQVVDPVLSVAALTPATPHACDMINVLCSCMSMVML